MNQHDQRNCIAAQEAAIRQQLDRKKRNHRIFTRGGMLEAFLQRPLLLTDDQAYRLLQTAFNTREVKDMESQLLAEVEHDCCRDKSERGTDDSTHDGSD